MVCWWFTARNVNRESEDRWIVRGGLWGECRYQCDRFSMLWRRERLSKTETAKQLFNVSTCGRKSGIRPRREDAILILLSLHSRADSISQKLPRETGKSRERERESERSFTATTAPRRNAKHRSSYVQVAVAGRTDPNESSNRYRTSRLRRFGDLPSHSDSLSLWLSIRRAAARIVIVRACRDRFRIPAIQVTEPTRLNYVTSFRWDADYTVIARLRWSALSHIRTHSPRNLRYATWQKVFTLLAQQLSIPLLTSWHPPSAIAAATRLSQHGQEWQKQDGTKPIKQSSPAKWCKGLNMHMSSKYNKR